MLASTPALSLAPLLPLIQPRLQRDFLHSLPAELALHVLSFVEDPQTLTRAARVSKAWYTLIDADQTWKRLCIHNGYPLRFSSRPSTSSSFSLTELGDALPGDRPASRWTTTTQIVSSHRRRRHQFGNQNPPTPSPPPPPSYKSHFKHAYQTSQSWLTGPGRLLSTQMSAADSGVVTSLAFDGEWIVVAMETSQVHVFEGEEGGYVRTLEGHQQSGVWCLSLVSKGGGGGTLDNDRGQSPPRQKHSFGRDSPPGRPTSSHLDDDDDDGFTDSLNDPFTDHDSSRRARGSLGGRGRGGGGGGMGIGAGGPTITTTTGGDPAAHNQQQQQGSACSTARGWGQEGAVLVSGGCDRTVRVWDVSTGYCIHTLTGHTSTVRCLRVFDSRPIAVSGSRDGTVRVWDIDKGEAVHVLNGHAASVRAIDVCGNRAVSASYDMTCRLWNVDTGECLHVLRGHTSKIYSVAFDGQRVVTGSLDSTVRVWSAENGNLIALLQGHSTLVGQLQLDPYTNTLLTGGSDGRVIVFSLESYQPVHVLQAHSTSVTCLQFDKRFIVTGGNDGRIKLWDFRTGAYVRDLCDPSIGIWRVVIRDDKMVTLSRREEFVPTVDDPHRRVEKTMLDVRTFLPPPPPPPPPPPASASTSWPSAAAAAQPAWGRRSHA